MVENVDYSMSGTGNSLFAEGKYEHALASYSDAIVSIKPIPGWIYLIAKLAQLLHVCAQPRTLTLRMGLCIPIELCAT